MKSPVPSNRQLEQLFQDLEDGIISASDHSRLMLLMDEHYEVRKLYRKHMGFVSALQAEADAHAKISNRGDDFSPISPTRAFAPALLAAVAVVGLLAAIGAFIAAPKPAPAKISASPGTTWKMVAGGYEKKGNFSPGTRVIISTGSLELTASGGTRVVVEGPADFEWTGPKQTKLREGQAWFAVARKDIGLTVELERMRVVDLGTEFGIRSVPGEEQIHVSAGSVRVEPHRSQLKPVVLEAGMAMANDLTGRLREIPYDSQRFHRQLPYRPSYIRWTFDEMDETGFTPESHDIPPHPLALFHTDHSPSSEAVLVPGQFGKAVDLEASRSYLLADYEGILGSAPRTVAIRMRAKKKHHITLPGGRPFIPSLLGWGVVAGGAKWHITTAPDGRAFSTLWGDSWITAKPGGGTDILDGEWHHLVSVFTGRHLQKDNPEILHYLNGRKIEKSSGLILGPVNTRHNSSNPQFLTIGLAEPPGLPRSIQSFVIDDVLIVRSALNESMVRRLYETNQLSFAPPVELRHDEAFETED